MILLSQWYEPDDADRLSELKQAREANETSGLFRQANYLPADGDRWSFREFFEYAASRYSDEVCVVANTDIVFGSTARLITSECRANRLVSLTRWEPPYLTPRMIGHVIGEYFFSGSQDAWAFIAGTLPQWGEYVPLGEVGCDQRVVGWAADSGCEVVNPSLTIKTLHLHRKPTDRPPGCLAGLYGYPEPTVVSSESRGLVLLHQWPFGESKSGKVVQTCQP